MRGEGEKERARCAVRTASLKTTTTHGSRSRPGSVNGDDGSNGGGGGGLDDSMYSASAEEAIWEVATEYDDSAGTSASGEVEMLFFIARENKGPVPHMCKLCGLEKLQPHTPTLVLLDIPNNGAFYKYVPRSQGESITARTITSFIAECKIGTCPKSQMALGIY